MNSLKKTLGIAALAAVGAVGVVAAYTTPAYADKTMMCRMKGTWVESSDNFEFDAVYIAKDGPDTFTGRYDNPGFATADIKGLATQGTWLILLTYTDAGHKGMLKEMKGSGSKDPKTHLLSVKGNYRTLLGTSDIKKDGTFTLLGQCK